MRLRVLTALASMACVSSCTTWDWWREGEYQEIIVKTDPPLADCTVMRNGIPIAHLYPTPGAVYIPKTKDAFTVTCVKQGYQTASAVNESDSAGATFVDFVMAGLFIGPAWAPISWAWDSINGSDNKYDSPMTVALPKKEDEAPQ